MTAFYSLLNYLGLIFKLFAFRKLLMEMVKRNTKIKENKISIFFKNHDIKSSIKREEYLKYWKKFL